MSFFDSKCLKEINLAEFGLCDDKENQPAYIDTQDKSKWIAEIINPVSLDVEFYAIDNCLLFENKNNNKISTCDAAIKIEESKLYFIELKRRKSKGWIGKAKKQLKSTLELYRRFDPQPIEHIICCASNSQRPSAPTSNLSSLRDFKQETGCKLLVQAKITLE